jgi:hypothetical protein
MFDHVGTILGSRSLQVVLEAPEARDDRFNPIPISRVGWQSTERFIQECSDSARRLLVQT